MRPLTDFTRETTVKDDDERILPLINIIFLLLIFFMLAGRIASIDPFDVAPPVSVSETPSETMETVVYVSGDGKLALNDEILGEAELRAAVAEAMAGGNLDPIRLKADGDADTTRVVAVMELLREEGIESLRLLTLPEGQ